MKGFSTVIFALLATLLICCHSTFSSANQTSDDSLFILHLIIDSFCFKFLLAFRSGPANVKQ
jgi:hypothetical protein